jgi:hypothetical protein
MGRYKKEDILRIRNNEERNRSINGEDIMRFIKSQRIRRLGHVKRMEVGAMTKKDDGRKTVCRKKKRKTSFQVDG